MVKAAKGKKRVDVHLDEDLLLQVRARLFDPTRVDRRIRHGALNTLIETLLKEWMKKHERKLDELG